MAERSCPVHNTGMGGKLCIKLASQLPSHSCIVHGAGSFGHFHASLYNIKAGTAASSSNLGPGAHLGMCETRRSVLKLNSMVSSALLDAKRCATPVHPMDSWVSDDTVLASADLTCVQRCLQLDVLPVLHGDVIFDSRRGYTVLSGDDIMQELSRRLQPPLVLFVSDVPGVFLEPPACASTASTKDPSFISLCIVDSSGCIQRLQHLESQHHELASLEVGGSSGTDITGGMRKKLQSACAIAASGIPVAICCSNISSFPPAFGTCTWILRDGMGVPSAAIQLAV